MEIQFRGILLKYIHIVKLLVCFVIIVSLNVKIQIHIN